VPPPLSSAYRENGYGGDLARLALVLAVFFYAFLGSRPLGNPDEGRYAEIPREMLATGDYVTPRLDGVKYFEKPPLVYWLTAGSMKVFGVNEFAARFWIAASGILGALLTYAAARALYDRRTGLWSAIVLATSLLYGALSHVLLLDLVVTVFIAAALFAFLLALHCPAGSRRRWLFWSFYAAMALAALTKGLIGIALPCAVAGLWVLARNRWSRLRPFYPFTGVLLFAVIAVPWHVLAARANPDFLYFYFIHEHVLRFLTKIHDRVEPWWYFGPILLGGLFPWVFFLFPALKFNFRRSSLATGQVVTAGDSSPAKPALSERDILWFLLIWVIFIFLFFSKSQSKLAPYILPVFPALAVLVGRYLAEIWENKSDHSARLWLYLYAGFAFCAAVALPLVRVARDAEIRAEIRPWQFLVSALFAISALAVGWFNWRGRRRGALLTIGLAMAAIMLALGPIFTQVDRRSTKPLALALAREIAPGDRVYSFKNYYQDLPVYLGRTVDVVDYRGELDFGIKAEPARTAQRFIGVEQFVSDWNQSTRCFAVAHWSDAGPFFLRNDFPCAILAEYRGYVLFSNR
jgi:4-amino-4-deoxy-L-arabinose transferase-like glycosyltransferase